MLTRTNRNTFSINSAPKKRELFFGIHSNMINAVKQRLKSKIITCAYSGVRLRKNEIPTIEHILDQKRNGLDVEWNFLPVTRRANNARGSIRLDKYITKNPYIPNNVRNTIIQVSQIITPSFNGKEWGRAVLNQFNRVAGTDLKINFNDLNGEMKKIQDKIKKPKGIFYYI